MSVRAADRAVNTGEVVKQDFQTALEGPELVSAANVQGQIAFRDR
jgi:hypothetical protein